MDKLQELALLVFITPLYVIVTVAIGALYVMAAVKAFQFIKKKLGKSEDEDAREYNQRRQNLYIYIPKRGYIRDLNHDCSELLYTDKEHEAKVFMYIDGIRGVLSYMKLVKNAGVTLPDYYIVTNGVKEEVAKIHFLSFKPFNFLTRVNYSAPVIKTDSGQHRSCEMMKMLPVSFLLVLGSQIFLTTVIVRYDHMEKYEAQLLIFAAQCCFIWYQIAMFESASREK